MTVLLYILGAMKLAIIADIHSNLEAFEAVLDDIKAECVEEVISLGDMVGYGPDPGGVVRRARQHRIVSVLGNHEYALANPSYYNHLNPTPRTSLDLNLKQLTEDDVSYLKGLPKVMSCHDARFVHGCPPQSPTAYLIEPSSQLLGKIFSSFPERLAFYGHTHNFALFELRDGEVRTLKFGIGRHLLDANCRYLINPGSVGQPRDGVNNQAKYCIWSREDGIIELRSIPYDIEKTAGRLRELGYPDFNAERLFY